ncbi:hypothetical protein GHK48_03420 [Sinorhizobium fredii]|uniref:Uncharacterized protein n=1 Tax=Rhizobium fredii TaxID=380 RepID=A0A844A6B1_RHIFR|nr:hypothetical protein [Sinorhizobium fredii]MQX07405.1 hypothetical protein [Sinorhizobium fredii]
MHIFTLPCFGTGRDWHPATDRRLSAAVSILSGAANDALLHVSINRSRFKDKNMQQLKVLQRPLCV